MMFTWGSERRQGRQGTTSYTPEFKQCRKVLDGFAKWRKGALAVRFVPVPSPWLKRVWQSPCTGMDNSSKWNSRSYQIIWIIWIICHFCQPFLQRHLAMRSLVAIVYASKRVRKTGSEHMLSLRFGDFSSWISYPKMEIEAVSIAYPPCLSSASVQPAPKQSECWDTSLSAFQDVVNRFKKFSRQSLEASCDPRKVPRYGFGRRFDEFRFGSWRPRTLAWHHGIMAWCGFKVPMTTWRSSKLCALTALIGMSKRWQALRDEKNWNKLMILLFNKF